MTQRASAEQPEARQALTMTPTSLRLQPEGFLVQTCSKHLQPASGCFANQLS